MATFVIGILVIGAMVLAARYAWKKQKNGECPGCSGGSCCHCCHAKPHENTAS